MIGGYKFSRRHTPWTGQEGKPQLVRLMKYQGKLRFLTLNCPQGLPCSPVVKISPSNAGCMDPACLTAKKTKHKTEAIW